MNYGHCFIIFALKDHFTTQRYPYDIIPLIMRPFIQTRRILEIKTNQTKEFKALFNIMSDLVSDCVIEINPREGFHINRVSYDKSRLFKINLQAKNFDVFYHEKDYKLGIDINKFREQLRMNNANPILFYINNDSETILRFGCDSKPIHLTDIDPRKLQYLEQNLMPNVHSQ